MNDNDRPRPPRPSPQSEPTLRTAPAPSSAQRPPLPSSPEFRAARNYDLLYDAVQKVQEAQAEQSNINKAFMAHAERLERALGVDEEPADGASDPPPSASKAKKPRNKVDAIALDSLIAKYSVYVLFIAWALKTVLEYLHVLPGAK